MTHDARLLHCNWNNNVAGPIGIETLGAKSA